MLQVLGVLDHAAIYWHISVDLFHHIPCGSAGKCLLVMEKCLFLYGCA